MLNLQNNQKELPIKQLKTENNCQNDDEINIACSLLRKF
jgi:hypothetical protein